MRSGAARVLIRRRRGEVDEFLRFLSASPKELYYTVAGNRGEGEDAALVTATYDRGAKLWVVDVRCTSYELWWELGDAARRALDAEDYYGALEAELRALCAAHGYSEVEVWDIGEGEGVAHLLKFRR